MTSRKRQRRHEGTDTRTKSADPEPASEAVEPERGNPQQFKAITATAAWQAAMIAIHGLLRVAGGQGGRKGREKAGWTVNKDQSAKLRRKTAKIQEERHIWCPWRSEWKDRSGEGTR